jgi:hypothetical protein
VQAAGRHVDPLTRPRHRTDPVGPDRPPTGLGVLATSGHRRPPRTVKAQAAVTPGGWRRPGTGADRSSSRSTAAVLPKSERCDWLPTPSPWCRAPERLQGRWSRSRLGVANLTRPRPLAQTRSARSAPAGRSRQPEREQSAERRRPRCRRSVTDRVRVPFP